MNPKQVMSKADIFGQNIRMVQDVISYLKSKKQTGILLLLDFEKAFDSIEWEYIRQSLKKLNFGPEFIRWVDTLYKNPIAIIKNNGWLSQEINSQRDIRQGCPISSLLFIIATESLAQRLKEKLGGIKITRSGKHINIKIAQYADDTILFLSNFKDVLLAIELLNKYVSVAGLKLNISKTEALYFAEDFDTVQEIHGIKCIIEGAAKCVGIYVGHNMEACYEKGRIEKIRQIDKLLQIWQKRNLTTFGKITILKCLAIPNIIHIAQNCEYKDSYLQE